MTPSVLIITQVFPPEVHPTGIMVRELGERMARQGWRVTVCAGLPYHPGGRLYEGWGWKAWERSCEGGIQLLRAGHFVSPDRSVAVRASVLVSQAISSAIAAMAAEPPSVVMVFGPPLVGPNLAAIVAAKHGARLINVIFDIYPDVAIETGKLTNRAVTVLARLAERAQYRASDKIVVLSEGFKRTLIAKGVPAQKIAMVPVWLDGDEIRPLPRANSWRREHGIAPDTLMVLYAGTIGVVSGATLVAEAAHLLRSRPELLFLFVGEGEEKQILQQRVRELGLTNVRFLPFQPRERLPEVQASADISLVTLAPGRGRTSVPSKVLGYMAAGRPIVASVDEGSDTAEQVLEADCGLVCQPGDPAALAAAIIELASSPHRRSEMGSRGRASFEARFAREVVLDRYSALLEELIRWESKKTSRAQGVLLRP